MVGSFSTNQNLWNYINPQVHNIRRQGSNIAPINVYTSVSPGNTKSPLCSTIHFPAPKKLNCSPKQFPLTQPLHGNVDRFRYQADTTSLCQLQVRYLPRILASADHEFPRRKKTKCTGDRPVCCHCRRNRLECIYEPYSATLAENTTTNNPAISLTSNPNNLNNVGFTYQPFLTCVDLAAGRTFTEN